MKKYFIFIALLFPHYLLCQAKSDTLTIQNTRYGLRFFKSNTLLTTRELKETLEINKQAYNEFKHASRNKIGYFFEYMGGFLVGWQIIDLVNGKGINGYLTGVAVTSTCISIPLVKAYKKHALKSVNLFNLQLKGT